MSEPRVGRVLVASLHQGIAEVLPDRLDFYENWLSVEGLREGRIGLAPLHAVLSFLRAEGPVYDAVTSRAGQYAADWTFRDLPALRRRLARLMPVPLRTRAALRTVRQLVRRTYPGSRAIIRVRRGSAAIDLRGSLFCEVRQASEQPLCGFYAAAIARVLELYRVSATTTVLGCRSAGGRRGCAFDVVAGSAAVGIVASDLQ